MMLLDIFYLVLGTQSISRHSWWTILVYESYVNYSGFSIISYKSQREKIICM
jgi:hypothetical protein